MIEQRDVFLVTGATGRIGTAFVHLLAADAAQPQVRVATRNVDSPSVALLRAFNPRTVRPVHFAVDRPETLQAALAGVTKLFVVPPGTADIGPWHRPVMEAAAGTGSCEYVVKVSVTGARAPDSDPPPGRLPLAHWQGEEAIRATGIPSTMIRPTIFMQHFLKVPGLYRRGDDRFYLPLGDARVAFLDCRDIAELAYRVFGLDAPRRRRHENHAYEFTGPAAVTAAEIAAQLSWAAGRELRHVDGEEAFVEHCKAIGAPDRTRFVYAEARNGWFSKVESAAFVEITGRLPTSFAKFAFDHASHFQAAS